MRLNTNSLKRTVAVLAAVCTLGTCCIAGSIAYADGANVGNIDATKKDKGTSITIHKYQGPATGERSDGTVKTLTDKKPVKGVTFKVCKVTLVSGNDENAKKIDLSTAAGWEKIKDIQNLDPSTKKAASFLTGDGHKFTTTDANCTSKLTGEDGSAKFDKLDESLYYVEETDTKDAQIKDGGNWKPVTVTGKVDPFFVTTPLSHKTDTSWEWLYDVNVYPKNDTSDDVPTKKAETPTKLYVDKNGDTVIPWDISIPLMPPSDNQTYKKIGFVDSLPEGLTYKDVTNVKLVKKAKTGNTQATDEPLTVNTDYTVTSTAKADSTPAKVKFELSASKLTAISKDFSANTYVLKVTLNTKITKGTKNFTNAINAWIDDNKIGEGDEDNPCVPTKENPNKCDKNPHGTSHFATLKITKFNDAKDTNSGKKPLKGAKFTVYPVIANTVLADVTEGKTKAEIEAKLDKGSNDANVIKLDETDEHGVTSADLFIGNGDDAKSKIYCVVEAEAPAGFKKDETPHCYSVEAETTTNVTNGVAANNAHEIKNSPATEIDKILAALPMTGARGLVLLTAFGIVGLGGTLFYIITRRRKEQEEA
ncbi:SpaH/EbpB family LPXTG-anchored major pilin [Gardnerella vaginalis]|uniref:SpaH/EbpB family LPXTG-anchored major pilin n=1 Tax=Gardnerella vaginalis TaxID=2702 RepID=UPI0003546CE8|nr:SpaH/EbpB family LPXTG-anchored major pilin [Gardnerella vaginalis]EPI54439.1 LPXTG-motif protein cell wall anchor domain protein [Gardnerella vaginalis JCP7276]